MLIRSCRAGDWPRLREIHASASREEGRLAGAAGRPPDLPDLEGEDAAAPIDGVFVAVLDGTIAGFVAVDGDEVTWLYVDPALQRRGVGRALLRHAVGLCGPEAQVEALAGNAPAAALYRSEGFAVVETVAGLLDLGHSAAVSHRMRRPRRDA